MSQRDGNLEIAMMDHIGLKPVSTDKRRRAEYFWHERRKILAIWMLILSGCAMTYVAVAVALNLFVLF